MRINSHAERIIEISRGGRTTVAAKLRRRPVPFDSDDREALSRYFMKSPVSSDTNDPVHFGIGDKQISIRAHCNAPGGGQAQGSGRTAILLFRQGIQPGDDGQRAIGTQAEDTVPKRVGDINISFWIDDNVFGGTHAGLKGVSIVGGGCV